MTYRFSKVWQGYPRNLWPWKPQNIKTSIDFEGSEAEIVKDQMNLKVLGVLAGRRGDSLQGLTTARPGANIVENVGVGPLGAFPGTLGTYAPSPARPPGPSRPGSRASTRALATYWPDLLQSTVLYASFLCGGGLPLSRHLE